MSQKGKRRSKEEEDIASKLIDVLGQYPGGILISSFWNVYTEKFSELPDYERLGLSKRSDLFDLLGDRAKYRDTGSQRKIFLVDSSTRPKSKAPETATPGKPKDPDKKTKTKAKSKGKAKPAEESSPDTLNFGSLSVKERSNKVVAVEKEATDMAYRNHRGARPRTEPYHRGDSRERQQPPPPGTTIGGYAGSDHFPALGARSSEIPQAAYYANQPVQPQFNPNPPRQQYQQMQYQQPQYRQQQQQRQPHQQQQQRPKHTKFVDQDQLEAVALDRMESLAEAKSLVTAENVEQLILQHYQVESLGCINNLKRIEDIQCVNKMIRCQCKVNASIQAFMKVRAVATLHEMHEAVKASCCEDDQDFNSLLLGPFLKQPLVYNFFQAPPDMDEIPEIDTDDVLEYLRNYLTKTNSWTSQSNKVSDLMVFIMETRGVDSPYVLGIRIRSMPLLIGVLKRAQRDMGNAVRSAMASSRDMIQSDLRNAAHLLVNTITEKEEVGLCVVRRKYLTKPFKTVVNDFFQKGTVLLDAVIEVEQQCGMNVNTRRNLHEHRTVFNAFAKAIRKDDIFCALLHLAMCCSKEEVHQQIGVVMGWVKEVIEVSSEDSSDGSDASVEEVRPAKQKTSKPKTTRKRPPLNTLVGAAKIYLERCILHSSLTLKSLARIENKLVKDNNDFNNFPELGQGTFLDFILENDSIKKMLEESGGSLLGASTGGASGGGGAYHPHVSDITDFILQCNIHDQKQVVLIEAALCEYYRIEDVRALGHSTALGLWQKVEQQQTSRHQHRHQQNVYYQGALCAKASSHGDQQRQVGVLGAQSKERAISCLQNCPLLENLAEWSHWELVFQPEMGPLKDFVQKHGGVRNITVTGVNRESMTYSSSILALETCPGTLLKLSSNTSPDQLAKAAISGDVIGTCGHLASLVALNGGLENTPTALLANHMKTALLTMQAQQQGDHVPGGPSSSPSSGTSGIVAFVLECLATLPLVICRHLANQIFLEPLTSVVGSTKSKELLLKHAAAATRLESRLQTLGFMLGIGEWAKSFQNRLELDESCLKRPERLDDGMGGVIEETYEDEDDKAMDVEPVVELLDSDDDLLLSDDDEKKDEEQVEVISPVKKPGAEDDDVLLESGSETDVTMAVTETSEDGDREMTAGISGEGEMDACKVIVDTIRSEEFGVDVKLSEDGEKLMRKQQERLGRSLDRLSKDLYSKDTHFVLELIQNADDNDYPADMLSGENSSCPSVKFLVTKESIQVLNNENGFEERNIRAICDVGRSTKGKHKFGYIGQKGIGFKSVFRVTNCPEIHSNGFHIKFDVNSSPMGYILPHWLEQEPNTKDSDKWKTRIVLPLTSEVQQGTQSLAARFHDVHPSLLLFLHRLRSLTVVNKAEDYTLKMQRRDLGRNVVEIRHQPGNVVDRWLVVRHTLDASHISLQAKSGVEVEATEMALAFPINGKEAPQLAQVVAEKQPVFAFLPLRTYGFRFIVQADFDVPSSREDVDKDSVWNQWLRSEIHQVFVKAMQVFREHGEFDAIQAVCNFLQFIPLEDEILDFFRPVASGILQQLRSKPCLPTEPNPDSKGVQWKLPSQLVLTRDPLIKSVVSAQVLQSQLSLDYLHSSVAAAMSPALMRALDIQTLRTEHLLQVGKMLLTGYDSKTDEEKEELPFIITQWLACIYRSLDDLQANDAILDQLRELPMIPLARGRMVRLSEVTVFFPLDRGEDEQAGTGKRKRDPMYYLEQDLDTVQLMLTEDNVINSQVVSMLEQLGVKHLKAQEITQHHIVPTLQEEHKWKAKSREVLLSYVVFLKEQHSQGSLCISMEELRPLLVVWTDHGLKKPAQEPVHFTPAYRNSIHLQQEFPGYDWTLLDAVYLQGSNMAHVAQEWREFFEKLGVLDFLATEHTSLTLTREQLASSPWSSYADFLPGMPEYIVQDCVSTELTALIENNRQPETHVQMAALFHHLSRFWDSRFSKCCLGTIQNAQKHPLKEIDTSFATVLKRSKWLPAIECHITDANIGDIPDVKTEVLLKSGQEIFLPLQTTMELMETSVPYLKVNNVTPSPFVEFLGIQTKISLEFVRERLVQWSKGSQEQRPGVATIKLNHITLIYKHLCENLSRKQLQDLLSEHPVIFTLPEEVFRRQDYNPGMMVTGQFKSKSEVRWSDPTELFRKHEDLVATQDMVEKQSIGRLYPGLEQMFVSTGGIQREPSLEDYAQLLEVITSSLPLPGVLLDTLHILGLLGCGLQQSQGNTQHLDGLKRRLAELPVIPVHGASWARVSDHPMIADDKELETKFAEKEGVTFVEFGERMLKNKMKKGKQPAPDPAPVRAWLEYMGVSPISACATVETNTVFFQPCPELHQYFHDVLPYIQQFLGVDYDEVYTAWIEDGIVAKLPAITFGKYQTLEVVHRLSHLPSVVVTNEVCRLKEDSFSILKDHVNSYNHITKEVARFFSRGDSACFRNLKSFLMELLEIIKNPSADMDRLIREYDLQTLPSSEKKWMVKEVNYALPAPPTPPPPPPQTEVSMEVDHQAERPDKEGAGVWPPRAPADYPTGPIRARSDGVRVEDRQWPAPAPPPGAALSTMPQNLRPVNIPRQYSRDPDDERRSVAGDEARPPGEYQDDVPRLSSTAPSVSGELPPRLRTQQSEHSQASEHSEHHDPSSSSRHPHSGLARPASPAASEVSEMEYVGSTQRGDVTVTTAMDGRIAPQHQQSEGERAEEDRPHTSSGAVTMVAKRPRMEPDYSSPRSRPVIFHGEPVWNQSADESVFEEVASGRDLAVPSDVCEQELDEANAEAIGRWGEQLVYSYYMEQTKVPDSPIVEVKWMNQGSEQGLPYDFVITMKAPHSQAGAVLIEGEDVSPLRTIFVEVKATLADRKAFFETSYPQLKFAEEKEANYHIIRVYNVGKMDEVKVVKLENLVQKLKDKTVKVCMVI